MTGICTGIEKLPECCRDIGAILFVRLLRPEHEKRFSTNSEHLYREIILY